MSASSPVETEVKLGVTDPESLAERIRAAGFTVLRDRVFEANTVYDTATGAVRASGHLLRLREAGDKCTLTWKGPSTVVAGHKQRPEIETSIGDARAFDTILRNLGYSPAFRYEKFRTEFARSGEPGIVTLDETPMGWFAELEGDAAWIDATAATLGYSSADYITMSYASLYLEHCRQTGEQPAWMVFSAIDRSLS